MPSCTPQKSHPAKSTAPVSMLCIAYHRAPMTHWWLRTAFCLAGDVLRLVSSGCRSHVQLVAENLFLRKQLALYTGRQVKPRRPDPSTRIALVVLSQVIDWRTLL